MSLYTMLQSCYVPSGPNRGHWATRAKRPIQVADDVAAPLVESGCLTPYPAPVPGDTGTVLDGVVRTLPEGQSLADDLLGSVVDETPESGNEGESTERDISTPRPRPRRRNAED